MREYTPENIESLNPNEIFVFGSNTEGRHGKGAGIQVEKWNKDTKECELK